MIVHLHGVGQSVYFHEWYKLLEELDDTSKHEIFVFCKPQVSSQDTNSLREKTINYCFSKRCLPKLILSILKSKRVMIHYLIPNWKVFLIYLFAIVSGKKITWILWGGDLYYGVLGKERKGIKRYLWRLLLKKIDEIACLLKEDFDIAVENTGTKAKYRYLFYPNPLSFEIIDKIRNESSVFEKSQSVRVLVGNSADPSNNHFEILDALFNLSISNKYNIEVICPLSYGNSAHSQSVIKHGKELFGDRFIALTELLEPAEYGKILLNVDVAIFDHRRQQALGNILALLYAEKKVYVRSDVSTWSFLKRYGITVYDTKKLLSGEDTELRKFSSEVGKKNKEIVRREFGKEHCVELWKKAFDDYVKKE